MSAMEKVNRQVVIPLRFTANGMLRIDQAAQVLSVSVWLLRKLAKEGQVKFVQNTPRSPLLFSHTDLEAWVRKNRQ